MSMNGSGPRLAHLDKLDGNRAYRSNEVSVLDAPGAQSTDQSAGAPLFLGQSPRTNPLLDTMNADRYYRSQNRVQMIPMVPVSTNPANRRAPAQNPIAPRPAPGGPLTIAEVPDINPVVARAVGLAAQGHVVQIQLGRQNNLFMRTQTALDFARGRELITPEQRLNIQISYLPEPKRPTMAESVARITGPPPVELLPPAQPLEQSEEPASLDSLEADVKAMQEESVEVDAVQVLPADDSDAAASPTEQEGAIHRGSRKRRP
jgi:hypothetical protein